MLRSGILGGLLSDKVFDLVYKIESSERSQISIIIPIFNAGNFINLHLRSLMQSTSIPVEVILINDYSSDNSHQEILNFLHKNQFLNHSILYFRTKFPVFESRCDDFGIRIAASPFVILVQADMKIHEYGFDKKMKAILEQNSNLGMLSARGVHSLSEFSFESIKRGREIYDNILLFRIKKLWLKIFFKIRKILGLSVKSPSKLGVDNSSLQRRQLNSEIIFPKSQVASRAGFLSEHIDMLDYDYSEATHSEISQYSNRIWFGETCMRGPMALRKSVYLKLGGFDTKSFYLGLDDHDFALRLKNFGMDVGFSPLYFASPSNIGVSRNKRKVSQNLWSQFHAFARRKNFQKSTLYKHIAETHKM